jgi:RNA polymerase sigma-70 factor (ECF subfamily)
VEPNLKHASQVDVEVFLRLLGSNERALFRYLLRIVPHLPDADDIMQEAKLKMYRNFSQLESVDRFVPWARKILLHEAIAYLRKAGHRNAQFSVKYYESLDDFIERVEVDCYQRQEMLQSCVKKLGEQNAQLISQRYEAGLSIETIAERSQKTVDAVYRSLSRIRKILHDCIEQKLAAES